VDSTGPVAAIDCGTNSTRLLVADADGRPLTRLMRITRLGEGVDSTGRLSEVAIDRCLRVLAEYRRTMDELGVVRARLVATSAARDASNGPEFVAAAAGVTGAEPALLSGRDEGRLSLAGAVADLDPDDGPFLVVDIGGGSTELVTGAGADDPELAVVSLQIGCVRVFERYLECDPPTSASLHAAREVVGATVRAALTAEPRLGLPALLVGLAGTVTTLSALEMGLAVYDRDRVHHSVLTAEAVGRWERTLAGEDRGARLVRPGMAEGREDVIVAGALILSTLMTVLGKDRCLVSEADILDGMVAGLVAPASPG